jgi:hypothetical protein
MVDVPYPVVVTSQNKRATIKSEQAQPRHEEHLFYARYPIGGYWRPIVWRPYPCFFVAVRTGTEGYRTQTSDWQLIACG